MKRFFALVLAFVCLLTFTSFAAINDELGVDVIYLDSSEYFEDEASVEFLDSGESGEPIEPGSSTFLDMLYYKLDVISAQFYVVIGIYLIAILLKLCV